MGEKLAEHLVLNYYNFNLFGKSISISDSVMVMWIVMAFLIVTSYIFTRNLQTIPKGKQKIAEAVVEFINNLCKTNIGHHHWKPFAPFIGTILLFLVFSNTISIFNFIPNWEQMYQITGIKWFHSLPHFGLKPPTKDLNVTAALAVFTIVVILFSGIIVKKPKAWLKSFAEPVPIILPFKILDYVIRPLSLCFRLFGNILGAFIVMELGYLAFPIVFPAYLSIYFDLFDGGLQAYIFVFLSSLYIAEAIE